jgi:hypothetical protein
MGSKACALAGGERHLLSAVRHECLMKVHDSGSAGFDPVEPRTVGAVLERSPLEP